MRSPPSRRTSAPRRSQQVWDAGDLEDALELGGAEVVDLDAAGAAVLLARVNAHARAELRFQAPFELGKCRVFDLRRRLGTGRFAAVRQRFGFAHAQPPLSHQ